MDSNKNKNCSPEKCTESVPSDSNPDSCRVCMTDRLKTNCAFEDIFGTNICDKLQFCTGLQVIENDGLPSQICTTCVEELQNAYKFKKTSLESDQTYRRLLLASAVKKEDLEDEMNSESGMRMEENFLDESLIKRESEDKKCFVQEQTSDVNGLKETGTKKMARRENSQKQPAARPIRRKRGKYKKKQDKAPPKPAKYRRLYCALCQIKFTTREQSDDHKKLVHKDNGKRWICEHCGKMFAYQSSHISHARCHLPPSFRCADCDYVTWHKHDLKKHVQRHIGFKEYQCEFCTSAYFCSSNLKAHISRVHLQVKRFKCPMCLKEFFERHKLLRHLDAHNDIKRFTCEICLSQFARSSYWRKHMLKSHGVDVPRIKPGRRKTLFSMGQDPVEAQPVTPVDVVTSVDYVTSVDPVTEVTVCVEKEGEATS